MMSEERYLTEFPKHNWLVKKIKMNESGKSCANQNNLKKSSSCDDINSYEADRKYQFGPIGEKRKRPHVSALINPDVEPQQPEMLQEDNTKTNIISEHMCDTYDNLFCIEPVSKQHDLPVKLTPEWRNQEEASLRDRVPLYERRPTNVEVIKYNTAHDATVTTESTATDVIYNTSEQIIEEVLKEIMEPQDLSMKSDGQQTPTKQYEESNGDRNNNIVEDDSELSQYITIQEPINLEERAPIVALYAGEQQEQDPEAVVTIVETPAPVNAKVEVIVKNVLSAQTAQTQPETDVNDAQPTEGDTATTEVVAGDTIEVAAGDATEESKHKVIELSKLNTDKFYNLLKRKDNNLLSSFSDTTIVSPPTPEKTVPAPVPVRTNTTDATNRAKPEQARARELIKDPQGHKNTENGIKILKKENVQEEQANAHLRHYRHYQGARAPTQIQHPGMFVPRQERYWQPPLGMFPVSGFISPPPPLGVLQPLPYPAFLPTIPYCCDTCCDACCYQVGTVQQHVNFMYYNHQNNQRLFQMPPPQSPPPSVIQHHQQQQQYRYF